MDVQADAAVRVAQIREQAEWALATASSFVVVTVNDADGYSWLGWKNDQEVERLIDTIAVCLRKTPVLRELFLHALNRALTPSHDEDVS